MTINCQKSFFSTSQKDTDIQKNHSKRQLASWAGFILFHVGKKKINTRGKAKDSREKERERKRVGKHIREVKIRVVWARYANGQWQKAESISVNSEWP